MAKIYRISLIEEDGDEYGTLFELAGSVAMLGAAAPGALAAALAECGIEVAEASTTGSASYFADAAGNGPAGSPVKPQRTRRTKAQMAADRAAAEAASVTTEAEQVVAASVPVDEPTPEQLANAAMGPLASAPYDPFRSA